MIYITVLGLICTLAFLLIRKAESAKKNRVIFIMMSSLLLGILMGMREITVGVDTATYYQYYNIINTYDWNEILSSLKTYSMEFGFALFMKFIGSLGGDYYAFQLIISVIMCLLIGKFILDNDKKVLLSILLYYTSGLYFYGYNISRQMLAVAIVCNAWSELKKNNFIKSLLYVAIGCCIHFSVAIFFVAYIVYFFRKYTAIQRIFTILLIGVTIIFSYWQTSILGIIGNYTDMYSNYLSTTEGTTVGYIKFIWGIIIILSLYVIYRSDRFYDYELRCLAIFSLINSLFWFAGTEIRYLERVGLVFAPFVVIFLPKFSDTIENKLIKYICLGLGVSVYIALFLNSITGQYEYVSFL